VCWCRDANLTFVLRSSQCTLWLAWEARGMRARNGTCRARQGPSWSLARSRIISPVAIVRAAVQSATGSHHRAPRTPGAAREIHIYRDGRIRI